MKKLLFAMILASLCSIAQAQKADIKFEKTTYDMGTFAPDTAIIKCKFVYKNTGKAPLYIHEVRTSCGCTQRSFKTGPTMPGESDTIFVTYNGTKKSPGFLRRSITVHCNAPKEMYTLIIKGYMLEAKITPTEEAFTEE